MALHINDIVKYSINMLWLNEELIEQRYIIGNDQDELIKRILEPGILWAVFNPDAQINIWYDSKAVTEKAKKNTEQVLYKLAQIHNCTNIYLRDIREISIVQNNADVFSANTPLYFRIDVLKAIFLVNAIETEHMDAALFTDLEIGDGLPVTASEIVSNVHVSQDLPKRIRMNKSSIFSEKFLKKLEKVKLLMSCHIRGTDPNNCVQPENQFLLLIADNFMIEAIKTVIINVNLERAIHILNMEKCHLAGYRYPSFSQCYIKDLLYSLSSEITYISTVRDVFFYYHALLEGVFPLKLINYITDKEQYYYPPIDRYSYFGFLTKSEAYFADTTQELPTKIIKKDFNYSVYNNMPTDIINIATQSSPRKIFLTAQEIGVVRGGNVHHEEINNILIPPTSGDLYRCSFLEPINTTMLYGSPVISAYKQQSSNNLKTVGNVVLFSTSLFLLAKTLKFLKNEKTHLAKKHK